MERIDDTGFGGIKVIQNRGSGYGVDAVLLAAFAAGETGAKGLKTRAASASAQESPRTAAPASAKPLRIADLGTGCGTIPLLWLKGDKSLKIDAVELQQNACKLAEKSVELNGFADNMKIINADLRELNGILPLGCYDLVVCNPPYKLGGSGIKNPESAKLIARHESESTLDDICKTASKLLPSGSGLFSRGQSKRRSFFCLRAGEAENAVISTLCPRCLSRTKAATFQTK